MKISPEHSRELIEMVDAGIREIYNDHADAVQNSRTLNSVLQDIKVYRNALAVSLEKVKTAEESIMKLECRLSIIHNSRMLATSIENMNILLGQYENATNRT